MNKTEKKKWLAKYGVKRQVEQDWLECCRERIYYLNRYDSKNTRLELLRMVLGTLHEVEFSLVQQIEVEKKEAEE